MGVSKDAHTELRGSRREPEGSLLTMTKGGWFRLDLKSPKASNPAMSEAQTLSLTLTINGEPRGFDAPLHIAGLVELLGLDSRKVAVERNLEIVPRSLYGQIALTDGDRIEIVHFIGGG